MTARLVEIANLITPFDCAADIGTDHAYLPVYLIKQKICARAIASDINKGPLLNAKQTVEENTLNDLIELRLGGGFLPYAIGEADVFILAGMGGHLIADILAEKPQIPQSAKQLILQPMQHPEVLRRYLCENGYNIEKEKFVREKEKFYQILSVVYTGEPILCDDFKLVYGISPITDDIYRAFLMNKFKQIKQILDQLSPIKHREKHNTISKELSRLKELINGN